MCSELHTAWHDSGKREAHLKEVVQLRAQRKELQGLAQSRTLAFAHECLLPEPGSAAHVRSTAKARGFLNLGNTCYINSVVHCLLHCAPFRQDLERQVSYRFGMEPLLGGTFFH